MQDMCMKNDGIGPK